METSCTIDLDVAHDSHPLGHNVWVTQECAKRNITFTLLQEIGPAGGNPLYRFTGTKDALTSFINECFFASLPGDEHCEFLLTFLEE